MVDYNAEVTPNQAWTTDGTAKVKPLSPFPDQTERTLPSENRPAAATTVSRDEYPDGLVVVKEGDPPATPTATLTMRASGGNVITITDDEAQEWPNGFVAWFTD